MHNHIECPNCQTAAVEYLGLQWFPRRVFEAWNWQPSIFDASRPDQGAIRLYTCEICQTTFAETPLPVA
jgi:hypothetical protein